MDKKSFWTTSRPGMGMFMFISIGEGILRGLLPTGGGIVMFSDYCAKTSLSDCLTARI